MADWLLKTEPDVYSYDDLVHDKKTEWDGVTNALALKHLRTIQKNDRVIIYHTGDERAAIGVATVTAGPHADPNADDEKLVVVTLKPAKKFQKPVTLATIKADPMFKGFDLIRIGRLSVVPVPPAMWDRIEELSR